MHEALMDEARGANKVQAFTLMKGLVVRRREETQGRDETVSTMLSPSHQDMLILSAVSTTLRLCAGLRESVKQAGS
jgi:hypothetical protein